MALRSLILCPKALSFPFCKVIPNHQVVCPGVQSLGARNVFQVEKSIVKVVLLWTIIYFDRQCHHRGG